MENDCTIRGLIQFKYAWKRHAAGTALKRHIPDHAEPCVSYHAISTAHVFGVARVSARAGVESPWGPSMNDHVTVH